MVLILFDPSVIRLVLLFKFVYCTAAVSSNCNYCDSNTTALFYTVKSIYYKHSIKYSSIKILGPV